jgi:mono/diheme cytochrome c family protein
MNERLFKGSLALSKILIMIAAVLVLAGCSRTVKKPAAQTAADSTLAQQVAVPSPSVLPLTYEQRQGKYFYDKYCAVCHGDKGAGDGFNSFNLDPKPHSFADSAYFAAISDASLARVIETGGRGVNKSVLMPSYGATLNQRDVSYVVAYLRTFAEPVNSAQ